MKQIRQAFSRVILSRPTFGASAPLTQVKALNDKEMRSVSGGGPAGTWGAARTAGPAGTW